MYVDTSAARPKVDRRIRRTRDRLGDALVELMQEQRFDTITVQRVLDRAEVGRSIFHAHFRDKDDLFPSDANESFESMAALLSHRADASERIAPVREMLAHLADVRPSYDALVASGRTHEDMALGEEHFARGIERRLVELPRWRDVAPERRAAMAPALAGAFMSLISGWIRGGMRESPAEMDELFLSLAWSGVRCAVERAPSASAATAS